MEETLKYIILKIRKRLADLEYIVANLPAIIKDHTLLTNIGTNTHAQIDTAVSNSVTHIAGTGTAVHGDTFLLNTGDISTGQINIKMAGNNRFMLFDTSSIGTGYLWQDWANTGGRFLLGLEGSTTGQLATGTLAYSTVLASIGTTAIHLAPNQLVGLTLLSGGNVGIGVTSFTSGGAKLEVVDGITFPATQVASSNVNTLDDYEEGTAVVALTASTSGTITINPSYKTISYVKIGKVVTISGYLVVASVSSPIGDLIITGLPFSAGIGTANYAELPIYASGLETTATTSLVAFAYSTSIYIRKFAAGAVSTTVAADVKANSEFIIGGSYIATA